MKGKNILYVLVAIIIAIVGFLSYKYFSSYKDIDNNDDAISITEEDENKNTDIISNFGDKKTAISEDSQMFKLFIKLYDYALEMNIKEEYTGLSKKNDMYFISLNDLSNKFGYDISIFVDEDGNVCDKNESGIYYDAEHMKFDNDNSIAPVLIRCFEYKNVDN